MASYEELAELNKKADKQASELAQQLTVKDILRYWNTPYSTCTDAEQSVIAKATELIMKAVNNWDGNSQVESKTLKDAWEDVGLSTHDFKDKYNEE